MYQVFRSRLMNPDGIEYFINHFCHGLPTLFENLGYDTIDPGAFLFFIFLTACSISFREMGRRSGDYPGVGLFGLLRWAGGGTQY